MPGGEVISALPYLLVKSVLLLRDKVGGVDVVADLAYFLVGIRVLAKDDIRADRAREKEHVLQHLTEVTAQGGNLDFLYIYPVDKDLSPLNIVVADDKRENTKSFRYFGEMKNTIPFFISTLILFLPQP